MKTLAFGFGSSAGRPYMVLLHTAEAPEPEEWSRYVEAMNHSLSSARALVHAFVATDGGSPDAAQRTALAHVVTRGHGALTHVFSSVHSPRRAVTAFHWTAGARAEAHQPTAFADVCTDCGAAPAGVLKALEHVQSALPKVQVLDRIRAGLPRG